jgi:hypothetical protein
MNQIQYQLRGTLKIRPISLPKESQVRSLQSETSRKQPVSLTTSTQQPKWTENELKSSPFPVEEITAAGK